MRTKSNVDLKQKSKKSLYFVLNITTIKLAPYLSNVIRIWTAKKLYTLGETNKGRWMLIVHDCGSREVATGGGDD